MAQRRPVGVAGGLMAGGARSEGDNLFSGGPTMRQPNVGYGGTATGEPTQTNPGQPGAGMETPPPTTPPVVSQPLNQPAQPQQRTYAPIQGFEFDKISGARPYDSPAKYSPALREFSAGLGSGVGVQKDNLGGMIDYLKQNGFTNARAVGDDKIDFGDGNGPIDVLNSRGEVWFQNGPDRFGGGAPAGGGMTMPAYNPVYNQPSPLARRPPDSGGDPRMGGTMTPADAAAAGLGWVPPTHPSYGQPGFVGPGSSPQAATPNSPSSGAPATPNRAPVPRPTRGLLPIQDPTGRQTHVPEPGNPAPEMRGEVLDDFGGPHSPEGLPTGVQTAGAPPAGPSEGRTQLDSIIQQLLSGDLNEGIINRRVDSARDALNKQRSAAVGTLDAQLAERGMGARDGTSESASMRLDQALNDDFAGQVNDIYANEAENADQRMMQALTTGAGLNIADAQNVIDRFTAETGRTGTVGTLGLGEKRLGLDTELGRGDIRLRQLDSDRDYGLGTKGLGLEEKLGLGDLDLRRYGIDTERDTARERTDTDRYGIDVNRDIAESRNATDRYGIDVGASTARDRNRIDELLGMGGLDVQRRGLDLQGRGQELDWNKFMAGYGLDRDKFLYDIENDPMEAMLELLQQLYGGASIGAGGYIG